MQFIRISFIILLGIYSIIFLIFSYKSGRFIKTILVSALGGLVVLTLVNLTSNFTGVNIAVNGWTVGSSALMGVPGVLGLLIVRLFF